VSFFLSFSGFILFCFGGVLGFFLKLYTKSSSLFALCDELAHGLSSVEAIECRRLQKEHKSRGTRSGELCLRQYPSSYCAIQVLLKPFRGDAGMAGAAAGARSPCQERFPRGGGERQPEEGSCQGAAASPRRRHPPRCPPQRAAPTRSPA